MSVDSTKPTFFVTGGAGFIGSAVIRELINHYNVNVVNIDKLTYAGNLESLVSASGDDSYFFEQVDICDRSFITALFKKYRPTVVMHLAAESHVDRSIDTPGDFISTNVVGTYNLLECARAYFSELPDAEKCDFRFHHISTDEVYGDLKGTDALFSETTPYAPSSPYSASKAASDHLVSAWHKTYDLPVVLSNCSNNYGPFQFPEKLIPLMIINALEGKALPVYGSGNQIRDWLYVEDHARALVTVATKGKVGETYNIGGHNQKRNIEVVKSLCEILEELRPASVMGLSDYKTRISFVEDRPGHDVKYAINASKIEKELQWIPSETFESGLKKTVQWYLTNQKWWQPLRGGRYSGERLGVKL